MLFALFNGPVTGWSLGEFAIALLIVAGIVAILFIALKAMNVTIPAWVIQIGWVIAIVFVGVFAIKLLMNMP